MSNDSHGKDQCASSTFDLRTVIPKISYKRDEKLHTETQDISTIDPWGSSRPPKRQGVEWEDYVIWDVNNSDTSTSRLKQWEDSGCSTTASSTRMVSAVVHEGLAVTTEIPFTCLKPSSASLKQPAAQEVDHIAWEDAIIWDAEEERWKHGDNGVPTIPTYDLNDDNIVFSMPEDIAPPCQQLASPSQQAKNVKKGKDATINRHAIKSRILLGRAGIIKNSFQKENEIHETATTNDFEEVQRTKKDPYNISNDEFYMAPPNQDYVGDAQDGFCFGLDEIQHAELVVKLQPPFIPSRLNPEDASSWHRPSLFSCTDKAEGPVPISSLVDHIVEKRRERRRERAEAGGRVDLLLKQATEDLSGKNGHLLMVEYSEEHPPFLSQVGMCSQIKNYYRPKTPNNSEEPPKLKYGQTVPIRKSPFLWTLESGECLPTLENNMCRTPLFPHAPPPTDFLLIRSGGSYFLRSLQGLFTAGQECPLRVIPGPTSKQTVKFQKDLLQLLIHRLFARSTSIPPTLQLDEISTALPGVSEGTIRRRLKLCSDFCRSGVGDASGGVWMLKPGFRLPPEEEFHQHLSPEDFCMYMSMLAGEQRLSQAGYYDYQDGFIISDEDNNEEDAKQLEDEVKTAPWNTTHAYVRSMKGNTILQLTGPADPTGCGEGFSYVLGVNKYVRNPRLGGDCDGGVGSSGDSQQLTAKRALVTGTNADLRRLSCKQGKAILMKGGVPPEEIAKLSRWEVIACVRTMSTEKALAGKQTAETSGFIRLNKNTGKIERYREECQQIFERQKRNLGSSEVLSTDFEESDDEEEINDNLELGKLIEAKLMGDTEQVTPRFNYEDEERERLQLKEMMMSGQSFKKVEADEETTKVSAGEEWKKTSSKILTITRTHYTNEGEPYKRTEVVRDPRVIQLYAKVRGMKDHIGIMRWAGVGNEARRALLTKRRRVHERLRRIKRNEERAASTKEGEPLHLPKKKRKAKVDEERKKKVKLMWSKKCGVCGEVGHMRTNRKACPLYQNSISSRLSVCDEEDFYSGSSSSEEGDEIYEEFQSESEEEEREEEEMAVDEDVDIQPAVKQDEPQLIRLEGTKLQICSKLWTEVAQEISGGRRAFSEDDASPPTKASCDYYKPTASKRQRIDPAVALNSIFEGILNELRKLKNAHPFLLPVPVKTFRDYLNVVSRPMDLQTMREKTRRQGYDLAEDFLADVRQIQENSLLYNGETFVYTIWAGELVQFTQKRLEEEAEELRHLEKLINPLLDTQQVGFNHIMESCLERVMKMPGIRAFLTPVTRKQAPMYHFKVERPIDLGTMMKKVKANQYMVTQDLMEDLELMVANAIAYNGPHSEYAVIAARALNEAKMFLNPYLSHLATLEENIRQVRVNDLISPASSQSSGGRPSWRKQDARVKMKEKVVENVMTQLFDDDIDGGMVHIKSEPQETEELQMVQVKTEPVEEPYPEVGALRRHLVAPLVDHFLAQEESPSTWLPSGDLALSSDSDDDMQGPQQWSGNNEMDLPVPIHSIKFSPKAEENEQSPLDYFPVSLESIKQSPKRQSDDEEDGIWF